jgi:hypothetical protein
MVSTFQLTRTARLTGAPEGTEKRGREEGKGGEERGRERREEECTECFIAAGLALGLGELCVFAVSLGPTGRLAPFRF